MNGIGNAADHVCEVGSPAQKGLVARVPPDGTRPRVWADSEPKALRPMLPPDQFEAIADMGQRLGHFTNSDVADAQWLMGAAVLYLSDCDTSHSLHLRWMQRRLLRGEYLTRAECAHILNYLLCEARRRQYAVAAAKE